MGSLLFITRSFSFFRPDSRTKEAQQRWWPGGCSEGKGERTIEKNKAEIERRYACEWVREWDCVSVSVRVWVRARERLTERETERQRKKKHCSPTPARSFSMHRWMYRVRAYASDAPALGLHAPQSYPKHVGPVVRDSGELNPHVSASLACLIEHLPCPIVVSPLIAYCCLTLSPVMLPRYAFFKALLTYSRYSLSVFAS